MKRTRKGFTLVELLIVVAILGTLAASMAISTADATASAKASAIANNVAACKNGAALYYMKTFNDTSATSDTASSFLKPDSDYVPNWGDFATGGTVTYTADSSATKPEEWAVTVNFDGDKEKVKIATALSKMPGYKSVTTSTTSFTVTLLTGKVTAGAAAGGGNTGS